MTGVGGGGRSQAQYENDKRRKRENRLRRKRNELNKLGARVWLLQGPELVRSGALIPDLFFKITSFFMDIPVHNVELTFHSVNMRLFNLIDKKTDKGFGFFKTQKKIESKRKDATERLDKRMKF